MMMKYSASQFSADRKRLMEIVANKITYVGSVKQSMRKEETNMGRDRIHI